MKATLIVDQRDDLPNGVIVAQRVHRLAEPNLGAPQRGKPPKFFDGNAQAFTNLRFHLDKEVFEFYQPVKMQDDPLWIDVTALLSQGQAGHEALVEKLADYPAIGTKAVKYSSRISRVLGILEIIMATRAGWPVRPQWCRPALL